MGKKRRRAEYDRGFRAGLADGRDGGYLAALDDVDLMGADEARCRFEEPNAAPSGTLSANPPRLIFPTQQQRVEVERLEVRRRGPLEVWLHEAGCNLDIDHQGRCMRGERIEVTPAPPDPDLGLLGPRIRWDALPVPGATGDEPR